MRVVVAVAAARGWYVHVEKVAVREEEGSKLRNGDGVGEVGDVKVRIIGHDCCGTGVGDGAGREGSSG